MICTCTHHVAAHDGYRPGRSGAGKCLASGCGCTNYVEAEQKSGKMDADLSAALLEFDRIEREHKKIGERLGAVKGVLKSKLMSQA